jgi:hypothetical protein
MNSEQSRRLEALRGHCVDREFMEESHGIAWPPDTAFDADFGEWMNTSRSRPCDAGGISRYAFEGFLQSRRLHSRRYAAARFGMTEESLDRLVPELPRLALRKTYQVYPGIIDESLLEDLTRTLPGLRFRTFGTHDFFCEFLHGELEATLKIDIEPLFCATSVRLGESRSFAATWDSITIEPLSIRHQVWLDFHKPLSLTPDRCSKLLYAEHHEELRPYLAGRDEPRDLGIYYTFSEKAN